MYEQVIFEKLPITSLTGLWLFLHLCVVVLIFTLDCTLESIGLCLWFLVCL